MNQKGVGEKSSTPHPKGERMNKLVLSGIHGYYGDEMYRKLILSGKVEKARKWVKTQLERVLPRMNQ